jgi:hypothetical protein
MHWHVVGAGVVVVELVVVNASGIRGQGQHVVVVGWSVVVVVVVVFAHESVVRDHVRLAALQVHLQFPEHGDGVVVVVGSAAGMSTMYHCPWCSSHSTTVPTEIDKPVTLMACLM